MYSVLCTVTLILDLFWPQKYEEKKHSPNYDTLVKL